MENRTVLVTGGAGYVGSHACKALAEAGYAPVVYDNLVYGHDWAVKWGPLIVGDLLEQDKLAQVLADHKPEAVLHFAAYAYVGESVEKPLKYYQNNVQGTLSLLSAMRDAQVRRIVFSSTCATYGMPETMPITETMPQNPINPYGHSKLMVEQILSDFSASYGLNFAALRYFNASGADPDGEIGEAHDPETHLIPRALMAVNQEISHLDVFGTDYDTPDGTCIRDFVHVADLAQGHIQALKYLETTGKNCQVNLGTGHGTSVKEILESVERVTGRAVPAQYLDRRPGDPAELYADISLARNLLGYKPKYVEIDEIIKGAWNFHQKLAQM